MRSYWEHVEEHIGNFENTLKSSWELSQEHIGNTKSNTLTLPKKKKIFTSLASRIVCSLPFLGAYNCILVWFALTRWGASQVFFFFLAMSKFYRPIIQKKKKKTMEAPQNRRFYFEVQNSSPLAHLYMWKRTTFAKEYEIKVRCYWELFGEHVRNLGTLCFDTPGTPTTPKKILAWKLHSPSGKWTLHSPHQTQLGKKKTPSPPSAHPQENKGRTRQATSHWLHGNSIPNIGCHYFWPGLIALSKNTLPYLFTNFATSENWKMAKEKNRLMISRKRIFLSPLRIVNG